MFDLSKLRNDGPSKASAMGGQVIVMPGTQPKSAGNGVQTIAVETSSGGKAPAVAGKTADTVNGEQIYRVSVTNGSGANISFVIFDGAGLVRNNRGITNPTSGAGSITIGGTFTTNSLVASANLSNLYAMEITRVKIQSSAAVSQTLTWAEDIFQWNGDRSSGLLDFTAQVENYQFTTLIQSFESRKTAFGNYGLVCGAAASETVTVTVYYSLIGNGTILSTQ